MIDLSGAVKVPRADIQVRELPASAVSPSTDVVVARPDAAEPELPRAQVQLVGAVEVTVGPDVRFRGFGLDTGLSGNVRISRAQRNAQVIAEGNLRSVQGTFKAFRETLTIDRGVLLFSGPVDNPNVAARASKSLRYEGTDVKVGVELTGSLRAMQTRVFSEPAMSEADALSYLVLSRPIRRTEDLESAELSGAAVALSMVNLLPVTGRVGERLGLSEVSFEGATEEESAVVAAKRIGENTYIRYSFGLFNRVGTFIVRQDLNRNMSLEASSGQEQAIDLIISIDR